MIDMVKATKLNIISVYYIKTQSKPMILDIIYSKMCLIFCCQSQSIIYILTEQL